MFYLYVLPTCPYCQNAIKLLKNNNIPFIQKTITSEEEKKLYKKKNKHDTFPQIILKIKNEKFLLGGSEVIPDIIKFYKKKI